MGAVLDSSENIRQNSTNTSRKAYKIKEKLEKNKDESVKKFSIEIENFFIYKKFLSKIKIFWVANG